MSIWDQFKGEYFKFNNPGDTVEGEAIAVRLGKDFKGEPCPELVVATPKGEKVVTAGQANLKVRLAEEQPEVGDDVKITYTGDGQAKPGQAAPKLFDVVVARGEGSTAVSASDL